MSFSYEYGLSVGAAGDDAIGIVGGPWEDDELSVFLPLVPAEIAGVECVAVKGNDVYFLVIHM